MSITHHPGDELLLSYAMGAASEPVALLIATHLAGCASCRAAVESVEATGGAMLAEIAPAKLGSQALNGVMSRLDEVQREGSSVATAPGDVPLPLRSYVGAEFAKLHWIPLAPGLAQLPIVARDGVRARLIRAKPGTGVSVHGHQGEEWTLVLTGSYHDETGRYFPGDVQSTTPDLVHQPIADEGPVCINLAVTDAPLVFEGVLPKVVGKIFGF